MTLLFNVLIIYTSESCKKSLKISQLSLHHYNVRHHLTTPLIFRLSLNSTMSLLLLHHPTQYPLHRLLFSLTLFVPPPGGPQPKTLHKVTLRVVSQTDCRNKYGPAAPGGIIESYLCAGTDGKDSCQVGLRGRRVRLSKQELQPVCHWFMI